MTKKYKHLLAPMKVGNHLFKNHICQTPNTPGNIQGKEKYPAEGLIQHYALRAKNGAALITTSGLPAMGEYQEPPELIADYFEFDIHDRNQHYLSQMVEAIHMFDTYATIQVQHSMPYDYDITAGAPPFGATFMGEVHPAAHEISAYDLEKNTYELAEACLRLKDIGFDGVFMHMSYQQTPLGRSLSPTTNQRTDKYGGSFEKRLTLVTETCQAIKDACGRDFIIEAHITGEERDERTKELIPGGWSLDDSKNFAEAMSGMIDILHLRGWSIDGQHPMGFDPDYPPYLYIAEYCMQAVTETKILCTAGNHDPDLMEQIIAEGKADLIGVSRNFVSNPDWVQMLYEDRADDIVPCIRCNKCFEVGPHGPKTVRCSVNPLWGHEHRVPGLVTPTAGSKKVAVIGGGPAGMQAARVCRQRGHQVDLYEKSDRLGGQLNVSEYSSAKWPLKQFKDFMIYQMDKLGVNVTLNADVTPEFLDKQGYDVVFAAVGSTPRMPGIPGIDKDNVISAYASYGKETELGKRIAIIGGGVTGIETALHLCQDHGCDVTVLEMRSELAMDAPPLHARSVYEAIWESLDGFHGVCDVSVQEITDKGVRYLDGEGTERIVEADSVIISCGTVANMDEAAKFGMCDARLITVGDSRRAGSVMELMRDAYFAAIQI